MATAETFRERLRGLDLSGFTAQVRRGRDRRDRRAGPGGDELLARSGTVPGLAKVLDRLGLGDARDAGQVAAAVEFVLEGLHLTRRLSKDEADGQTVYGS